MIPNIIIGTVAMAVTVWMIFEGSPVVAVANAFVAGANAAFALSIYWMRK